MKLSTLRENIGSEVKLSKSANTFIKGCRFYIETANTPDIKLMVVGPTATTFSYRQSRSIVSLIIPVKKAPSIKTMKGKSFSNEFKVLCSLMLSAAGNRSVYVVTNNKEISTLTEAGLLKEMHGAIVPTTTGRALVKKRLASIIKSGKTFYLRGNIVKVVRQHNTAIELEILKTGETLRSNIEEFPYSAITVKYTKPVVKIKEGDIVRIINCTDRKSIIGKTAKVDTVDGNSMKLVVDGFAWWVNATDIEFVKTPVVKPKQIKEGDIVLIKKCNDRRRYVGMTAKVAQYRADTTRLNTELIIDGVYWWVNYTDIEFVKTPATKKPKVVKPKEPKVGDNILLDIETHNPCGWVDELKENPELPWQLIMFVENSKIKVKRGTQQWLIGKDNIKKVLTKREAKILIKVDERKAELIAEKKKATARLKRVKAYKTQVAKVLELQKQLNKEIDKRRELHCAI